LKAIASRLSKGSPSHSCAQGYGGRNHICACPPSLQDKFNCDPNQTLACLANFLVAPRQLPVCPSKRLLERPALEICVHSCKFVSNLSVCLPTRASAPPSGCGKNWGTFPGVALPGRSPPAKFRNASGVQPNHPGPLPSNSGFRYAQVHHPVRDEKTG